MLSIPTRGISRSVDAHNVKLDVLCDWIEASVLFVDGELSPINVVDTLTEEYIYAKQDMASRMVGDAWAELRRRQSCLGDGTSFTITTDRITRRRRSWKDTPAHSFCVLLSLAKWYSDWARQFGKDYTEQGELFEELTKQSLEAQFLGWQMHLTGWSRTRTHRLTEVVEMVANRLGESKGNIERWNKPTAKEAGLDLLCYRPFPDNRVGIPVYLMQCASGGDWAGKLHTPSLKIWTDMVKFIAKPKRAFATPFAFLDDDFVRNCQLVGGMLLDRYRLLSAVNHKKNWLSNELKKRLIAWSAPRISKLPRRDL